MQSLSRIIYDNMYAVVKYFGENLTKEEMKATTIDVLNKYGVEASNEDIKKEIKITKEENQ